MVNFKHYLFLSTIVTVSALSYAFYTRRQFYNAAIYITTHKIMIVVLGNLAFLLLLLLGKGLKRVFLGTLTRDEIEELVQNSKYAITETMLALTIFREELNLKLLMLFTGLLFIKIFHWLVSMRVESIARSQAFSRWQHMRLVALISFLALVDCTFVLAIAVILMQAKTASVLLLFGFEYMILFVMLSSTFFKYVILVLDARWESRGQHWPTKNTWMFYLEFTADLVRLFLYLIFFVIICSYYALPLHLIRELGITFYNLRERILKFIQFRKITKNMNERFPDATAEELQQGDKTCIVCREDMEVGHTKKLPCGHMFHFVCLRTWLERSQSCPTCRAEIPVDGPILPAAAGQPAAPPAAPVPNNANGNVGAAGGAAAAQTNVAAIAAANGLQLPPLPAGLTQLPPHIQMHLDALRLAAAQARAEIEAAEAATKATNANGGAAVTSQTSLSASSSSIAAASSATNTNQNSGSGTSIPPASPLHPLFGSTPLPPAPSAHNIFQFPLVNGAAMHVSPAASFGFHPMPSATVNATTAPSPFGISHPTPAFMFPPPPPPPPMHLFGAVNPSPFPAAAMPLSSLPPSDPLFAAYMSHHAMMLRHHHDFLTSSLNQVKILMQQQQDMERKYQLRMEQKVNNGNNSDNSHENDDDNDSTRTSDDSNSLTSTTAVDEANEDGNIATTVVSQLSHRKPHQQFE